MSQYVRPHEKGVYELPPYPFAANSAEFAAGRRIEPGQHDKGGMEAGAGESPTRWESFRLIAA
jgi:hypothetical protein